MQFDFDARCQLDGQSALYSGTAYFEWDDSADDWAPDNLHLSALDGEDFDLDLPYGSGALFTALSHAIIKAHRWHLDEAAAQRDRDLKIDAYDARWAE